MPSLSAPIGWPGPPVRKTMGSGLDLPEEALMTTTGRRTHRPLGWAWLSSTDMKPHSAFWPLGTGNQHSCVSYRGNLSAATAEAWPETVRPPAITKAPIAPESRIARMNCPYCADAVHLGATPGRRQPCLPH